MLPLTPKIYIFVRTAGFEPATSRIWISRSNQLNYIRICRVDRTRTCDLLVPNQARYLATLISDMRKRESNFYLQFSLVPLFILISNYGTVVSSPIISTIIFVVTLPPLTCFFIIPQQFLEKVVVRDTSKHGSFF